jgi:decaprenylphospho-beta-D-ribofuranose 2-oxidase
LPDRVPLSGWGRTSPSVGELVRVGTEHVAEVVRASGPRGLVVRGLGRSYGDAAQNAGGTVMVLPDTGRVEIDSSTRVARVPAGLSLHSVLRQVLPQGFYVPVTPGTRYVTVGGAVAADIHGKNHHRVGSLGAHLTELTLVDGTGETRHVSADHDRGAFEATVGGMGLTGVVTEASMRLLPVETGYVRVRTERAPDLATLMQLMVERDPVSTYSVAWVDLLATGSRQGRSVLTTGEHAAWADLPARLRGDRWQLPRDPRLSAPGHVPAGLVNPWSVRVFNEAWYRQAPRRPDLTWQSHSSFFHPLDAVGGWNRLYGPRGFVQYQFVVPEERAETMHAVVERITATGLASFLAVLKRFGAAGPGMLSFPCPGWTLALDLPVHPRLGALLGDLDALVVAAGGRVYLAKDSRLPPELVRRMYPRWDEFSRARTRLDPDQRFVSDLSRRLRMSERA